MNIELSHNLAISLDTHSKNNESRGFAKVFVDQ